MNQKNRTRKESVHKGYNTSQQLNNTNKLLNGKGKHDKITHCTKELEKVINLYHQEKEQDNKEKQIMINNRHKDRPIRNQHAETNNAEESKEKEEEVNSRVMENKNKRNDAQHGEKIKCKFEPKL